MNKLNKLTSIEEKRYWFLRDFFLGTYTSKQALEKAQLKEFVKKLPDGIDTIVGERGVKFSGGQRQRVAIARALYYDPDILVLDEADKILDLGFAHELEEVLSQLPSQRQNLFFSATYPQKINNLVKKISDSTEIIKWVYNQLQIAINEYAYSGPLPKGSFVVETINNSNKLAARILSAQYNME